MVASVTAELGALLSSQGLRWEPGALRAGPGPGLWPCQQGEPRPLHPPAEGATDPPAQKHALFLCQNTRGLLGSLLSQVTLAELSGSSGIFRLFVFFFLCACGGSANSGRSPLHSRGFL